MYDMFAKGPADTQNAVLSLGPLEVLDSVEVLSAPFPQSAFSIACEAALGSAGSYAQVEYTVYRDQEGNIVDEDHPSASATR